MTLSREFYRVLIPFFLSVSLLSVPAQGEQAQSMTIDGQLFHSGTTNPIKDSVIFTFQILNPDATCVLYEEQQTLSTVATNGKFATSVGTNFPDLLGRRTTNDSSYSMSRIFNNFSNSFPPATGCPAGYTPLAGHARLLRIMVHPSLSVSQTLQPDIVLNSVPTANVAESLGGLFREDFLQVNSTAPNDLSQTTLQSVFNTTRLPLLLDLIDGTSSKYVRQAANGAATVPTSAGNPAGVTTGQMWYDTSTSKLMFRDGTGNHEIGAAGAGITSLGAGTGLNVGAGPGGTITTTGTLNVDVGVTAGKIVQVQTGGKLPALDGSDLTALSGTAIQSGTIGGTTMINSTGTIQSGAITSSGSITGTDVRVNSLKVFKPSTSNYVEFVAPAGLSAVRTFTLPETLGTTGQVLQVTDNAGTLGWQTPVAGSVTSVGVSVPAYMTSSGGPVTSSGTVALSFNSQSAAQVFASPAGASGAPTFRSLGILDLFSTVGGLSFLNTTPACTAGKALSYISGTDRIECVDVVTSSTVNAALGYTPANGASYVAKAGDTMTGALNLPSNGLAVGTSQLVVTGGRVGIGTTNPTSVLPSANNVLAVVSSAGGVDLAFAGNGYARQFFMDTSQGVNQKLYEILNYSGQFQISRLDDSNSTRTTRFLIDTGGNVAIGTVAPGDKLHVDGRVRATHICAPDGTNCKDLTTSWGSGGTVTSVATGTGLTGGPITTSGTISIAAGGVSATELASNAVTTGKINDGAVTDVKINDVAWSKITSKPTTLSGYGVTDAVANAGAAPSLASGLDASKPAAGSAGRIYVATDTLKIYRDNGTLWEIVASSSASDLTSGTLPAARLPALTGDVSSSAGSASVTLSTVPIGKGGTGQTTPSAALNALLPAQSTHAGKVLQTDGTNAAWVSGSSGSVTSVDVGVPAFMTSSGGPVTSSGTISLSYNSQSARQVFASPTGASGAPTFRNLNILDLYSTVGGLSFLNTTPGCTAGRALSYISGTDRIECVDVVTAGSVTRAQMQDMATASFIGRNTAGTGAPEVVSASTARSMLSISNVENTALSTWTGSSSVTTLGTISTGTWNGSTIPVAYGGTGTTTGSITGTTALTFAAGGSNQNVTLTPSGTGSTILNGNVGVGTTSPGSGTKLNVEGQIRSKSFSETGNSINWSNGNAGTTSHDCGTAINFENMRDGGSYTLVVTGAGTTSCTFGTSVTGDDAATVAYRFLPANAVRTASSHSVYSFMRIGSVVYVSWMTGFVP